MFAFDDIESDLTRLVAAAATAAVVDLWLLLVLLIVVAVAIELRTDWVLLDGLGVLG